MSRRFPPPGPSLPGLPRHRQFLSCTTLLAGLCLLIPAAGQAADAPAATPPDTADSAPDASRSAASKPAVGAAASGPQGEEIKVVARHREEKLQDMPQPVSTISGKTADVQHLSRVADYQALIPNFSALQQNPRVSAVFIRGVGGNASNDGSESSVGLIVDDVFMTHVGFSWLDYVDLDHIEVVRGPQGTLLGKNTTVGAVIVTTKPPSFTPGAELETSFGNHNEKDVRINLTGPLLDDKLAIRGTFYGDWGDGWVTNRPGGQTFLDNNRHGARVQLLFTPNENFTDRLILEDNESREYNNYYPPFADVTRFANGAPRNAGWYYNLTRKFGFTPSLIPEKNANFDTQDRLEQKTYGISNNATWTIGDYKLSSITAYRYFWFRPHNDSDVSPFPIFRNGYNVNVNQLSQEFRLASPAGRRIEWQTGLYGLREAVRSDLVTNYLAQAGQYFAPLGTPTAVSNRALNGLDTHQLGQAKTTSLAVFGQTTVHLTDRAALTIGLRGTHEERYGSDDAFAFGGDVSTPATAALRNSLVRSFSVSSHKNNDSVSWLVNPSYKLADNLLAYVSVGQGVKSGAVNTVAVPGQPVIIQPETSTDVELGIKSSWLGGKLVLNANLYWNNISDYQASAVNTALIPPQSYLTNVGTVRLAGLEIDSRYNPAGHWVIVANLAYNDAVYESYRNSPRPVELSWPGAPPTIDLSGKTIPYAPRWSGTLGLSNDVRVTDQLVAYGYVNERFQTREALGNPSSAYVWQGGYALTDLGLGLRTTDSRYDAQLYVRNLFDRRYWISVAQATATTPYQALLGDPFRIGVTLRAKF